MDHQHLVLVVDDEPYTRDFFADVLRESGAGVTVAENGEAAIEIVQAGIRPCVVLTDVRMPRMDGWELYQAVRKLAPEVPVVLMTSDRLLTIAAPVLPKPVAAEEVEALVRSACPAVAGEDAN